HRQVPGASCGYSKIARNTEKEAQSQYLCYLNNGAKIRPTKSDVTRIIGPMVRYASTPSTSDLAQTHKAHGRDASSAKERFHFIGFFFILESLCCKAALFNRSIEPEFWL
ncbi:hypothetical protein FRX31_024516, partial [Thalictrum thalictroides]